MKKVILSSLFLLPAIASADVILGNVGNIITAIGNIIKNVIPIVFSLILVYFFWGLAVFVLNAGDPDKRKEGRGIMIWGLVALFVAASVWGLTAFIGSALDLNGQTSVPVPRIGN